MKSTSFLIPKSLNSKVLGKSYETGASISSIVTKLLLSYAEGDIIIRNNNPNRNVPKGAGEVGMFNYINELAIYSKDGKRIDTTLTVSELEKYLAE